MNEFLQQLNLETLSQFIHDHWLKALGAFFLTVATSWVVYFQAWRRWVNRRDMDTIQYSQNDIEERPTGPNGEMERWLILESQTQNPLHVEIDQVIPRRMIKTSAGHTTLKQPLLGFPKKDRWYVLNLVLLAIAEHCKTSTIAKLSKRAVVDVVQCIFALSYERYGEMRQEKLRVMIVREDLLKDPLAFEGHIRFESPTHEARLTTLRAMQADYFRGQEHWQYCHGVRINVQL